MTTTAYMIRSKKSPDTFVRGTPFYHHFTVNGRIFSSLGQVRTFITGVINDKHFNGDLEDWEVINVELRVLTAKPVHEVIKPERLLSLLTKTNSN